MPSTLHFGMIDKSGEQSGVLLHIDAPADGDDYDAIIDPVTGIHQLLKDALIPLTKLNLTRTILSVEVDTSSGSLPSAADAQREWAIRFTYKDLTTNRKYSFTVPAPVDAVVQSGTDEVDGGNLLIAAFITAVEAYCKSPDGNDIDVQSGRIIGRNS